MAKVVIAETVTFDTDDKRAQYARLAVWNHGLETGTIKKGTLVNEIPDTGLILAWRDLTHGTYLEGPEGIKTIMRLTKFGALDQLVAERGLTRAYAQEVRPFLRRGHLSSFFGRRGSKKVDVLIEEVVEAVQLPVKPKRVRNRKKAA